MTLPLSQPSGLGIPLWKGLLFEKMTAYSGGTRIVFSNVNQATYPTNASLIADPTWSNTTVLDMNVDPINIKFFNDHQVSGESIFDTLNIYTEKLAKTGVAKALALAGSTVIQLEDNHPFKRGDLFYHCNITHEIVKYSLVQGSSSITIHPALILGVAQGEVIRGTIGNHQINIPGYIDANRNTGIMIFIEQSVPAGEQVYNAVGVLVNIGSEASPSWELIHAIRITSIDRSQIPQDTIRLLI